MAKVNFLRTERRPEGWQGNLEDSVAEQLAAEGIVQILMDDPTAGASPAGPGAALGYADSSDSDAASDDDEPEY